MRKELSSYCSICKTDTTWKYIVSTWDNCQVVEVYSCYGTNNKEQNHYCNEKTLKEMQGGAK